MNKQINITILSMFAVLLNLSFASAMIVNSVDVKSLYPGQSASLSADIKNTLNEDVSDVSLALNLEETKFTTIGSSEDSEDEINEDDKETFSFTIKAASDIKPGDYNIPYTLTYTDSNDEKKTKTGSIGITVSAKTEINYAIETKNNIVGEQGKVSIKTINSGLGEIRFVNVKIISAEGFEVLSSNEEYIGNINSDDFELATFDVFYKKTGASITALVKYKNSENEEQSETVTLPIQIYSREKALELGLIKKSNIWIYGVIIALIIIWFIYRKIKKKRNKKNHGGVWRWVKEQKYHKIWKKD